MLRRKAPVLIVMCLVLLTGTIGAIIVFQPKPDSETTQLDAARRQYSQDMLAKRAAHVANIEGVPEGAGETVPWSEIAFPTSQDGRYTKLFFGALSSFPYDQPAPEVLANTDPKSRIPEFLHKYDRAPVMMVGYMVPLEMDSKGRATTFALTQNQQFCCYGEQPKINEFAVVNVPEGVTPPKYTDQPVTVAGSFGVGENVVGGYVDSLFRLVASEVKSGDAFAS